MFNASIEETEVVLDEPLAGWLERPETADNKSLQRQREPVGDSILEYPLNDSVHLE